ncbi:hypothetical protein BDN67DRAFT_311705 [Paxillus ammoniavirescens]|nr:hypothetical protein BDN67DRAFT_311705 [Paxillus ammoniavirescens]
MSIAKNHVTMFRSKLACCTIGRHGSRSHQVDTAVEGIGVNRMTNNVNSALPMTDEAFRTCPTSRFTLDVTRDIPQDNLCRNHHHGPLPRPTEGRKDHASFFRLINIPWYSWTIFRYVRPNTSILLGQM